MLTVYGLVLGVTDLQPNIGQFWYFFTMMFKEYRVFFTFVLHSFLPLLSLPLALRFPHRPLMLTWAHLLMSAMMHPYASLAHVAAHLSLLPLLQPQLRRCRYWLLLLQTLVVVAVLVACTWHQWVQLSTINANYFYAMTLLAGVWQVVLLLMVLQITIHLDWDLKPKPNKGCERENKAA